MSTQLITKVQKLAGHHILCVGDIMLDRFVYGHVNRISPEAPVPVLHVKEERSSLGGCGNLVRNIVDLGGHVDVVGVVGHDPAGHKVVDIFSAMHQVVSYTITDSTRPTTIKTRYVQGGHQLLRADEETTAPVSSDIEEQIMARVHNAIEGCEVVVLSDYAKGVLTDRIVKETIALARAKNKFIMIDPKGRNFERYRGVSLLTPNKKELADATGLKVETVADAEKASRHLMETHGVGAVMAKLSADGIGLILKDKPLYHVSKTAKEIFDVSGAGDTVVGAVALSVAAGLPLEDAAEIANTAGAIVVNKVGTATVTADDMIREIQMAHERAAGSKLMSWGQAYDACERWRSQGIKVGFTNGCFDLLHLGHISLLEQCRKQCDRLIVGLNTDRSTRIVKGEGRPVQNEHTRATVLAALTDVDIVVLFDEETPYELIQKLRPQILIKGKDYKEENVVGADLVKSWGGQVHMADLLDGQSTTSTISKMGRE